LVEEAAAEEDSPVEDLAAGAEARSKGLLACELRETNQEKEET
jgi:hypothetical protein